MAGQERKELRVYLGTYTEPIRFGTGEFFQGKGEGIYLYAMDPQSGALRYQATASGIANPSYLAFHPSGRFLYAVNELKRYEGRTGGALSAFTLDRHSGELTALNSRPTRGADPCHVTVDRSGRFAFAANFTSGSVCVFPIAPDGSLEEASDFVQHEGAGADPVRQSGPHAHSLVLDAANRFAFVSDLGLDRLMVYRFDSSAGTLRPHDPPWISTEAGAGPRHFAFHPHGGYAYLINELNATVCVFRYDGEAGRLEEIQSVPTLPADFRGQSTGANIELHPTGRFLYASNRGHDSITAYAIDPGTGRLNCLGHQPTQGKTPRHFSIDPNGRFLLAANQDSDNVVTLAIDPHSGLLKATGAVTAVPTPVCVKFPPG